MLELFNLSLCRVFARIFNFSDHSTFPYKNAYSFIDLLILQLIEDIEAIQEKLEVRNNRLLALRQRRDELNATLDKAGVDLKQVGLNQNCDIYKNAIILSIIYYL